MAGANEAIQPQDSGLGFLGDILKLVTAVKGSETNAQTNVTESGGPSSQSVSSSVGGSSSTPGDLKPLYNILAQQMPLGTMEGMAPILQAIFSEGSKQLPNLYSQAGAVGSRVQSNSIIAQLQQQLGTDLANKVALLLSANQQAAAKTAEAIAAQGRRTSSSQSSNSTSTTTPGTRTVKTEQKGSTPGALGANGLQKLLGMVAGGSLLNNFAGPALKAGAGFLGGLFNGSPSSDAGVNMGLGQGLSLTGGGLGLQPQAASLGLNLPQDPFASLNSFPSLGLNLPDLGSTPPPLQDISQLGQGLDFGSGGGLQLPDFNSAPSFDFGGGFSNYTPADFSSFAGASNYDVGGLGFQAPSAGDIGLQDAANYTPTDFSSFGQNFSDLGLGFKPSDFADFFGGAFADGGLIEKSRGAAKYFLGTNPIVSRLQATNYAARPPTPTVFAPGAAASFGGSNQLAVTNSSQKPAYGNRNATFDASGNLIYAPIQNPTAPSTLTAPTLPATVDRAAALEQYRATLQNQDLYSPEGNTLSVWKDAPIDNSPEGIGASQQLLNLMRNTPDVLDAATKSRFQQELTKIKQTIPVSMSVEQARNTFNGIENLDPKIQQAIADDPRRFAASMKGLLPVTDPALKGWTPYARTEGDYAYSAGGRNEPYKGVSSYMQWHPQYGLLTPPGGMAPNYELSGGVLEPFVGPVLSAASLFFPVLAPYAAVYNAGQAASNDNLLGFGLGALGLGGAAAGLAGNPGLAKNISIGSNLVKVGDSYFKYKEYQDYVKRVEDYNRKVNEANARGATSPGVEPQNVSPGTTDSATSTIPGQVLQQSIQSAANRGTGTGRPGAVAVPATERIFGQNSILDAANVGGVGSPAYGSGAEITLDTLPSFLALAQNFGGIPSPVDSIPKKADGGSLDFRMMQVDKMLGVPTPTMNSAPTSGGKYSIDEEFAKSRGITVQQVEKERADKLRKALKNRRVTGSITGPGTPTSDNLLIAASPSEYVLPSDMVTRLGGASALDEILAMVHTPT